MSPEDLVMTQFEKAIFQTFWKLHCCTKFLFFWAREVKFWLQPCFLSPLKWWGQILLNLTFRIQKLHILGTIPGKMQVPLCQKMGFLS